MKKLKTLLFVIIFLVTSYFAISLLKRVPLVQADKLQEIQQQIDEYQNELTRLNAQSNTLKNQIAQFDAQIRLTQLKIQETEEKIALLGGRIDLLEVSLEKLTEAFSNRATETYKMARLGDPLLFLISSPDLSEAATRFHYLKRIQDADRDLLVRLQEAQNVYQEEKVDQEDLNAKLNDQRKVLGVQKTAKADLLTVTKNEENKYQQLLAQARAEYQAIQAIIAGKGTETQVGHVNEGQRIASIIQGSSCNSSGAHLHFVVARNGTTDNPFSLLKSGISFQNCSGAGECSEGDPFNPSGSWEWPINPTIKFTQGYGETWAVKNTWVGQIYRFHNGIDINSLVSSEVKAVKGGTLYRGSYNVGCALGYVRVDHDDLDIDTFYLHVY